MSFLRIPEGSKRLSKESLWARFKRRGHRTGLLKRSDENVCTDPQKRETEYPFWPHDAHDVHGRVSNENRCFFLGIFLESCSEV